MTFTIKIGEAEYFSNLKQLTTLAHLFKTASAENQPQVLERFKLYHDPTPNWAEEVPKDADIKTFLQNFLEDPDNSKLLEVEALHRSATSVTPDMMLLAYLHWLEHQDLRSPNTQEVYDIVIDYIESYPYLADRLNVKSRLIEIASAKIVADIDRAIDTGKSLDIEDAWLGGH